MSHFTTKEVLGHKITRKNGKIVAVIVPKDSQRNGYFDPVHVGGPET